MASITLKNRNAEIDAVTVRCNNGLLRLYSGVQPANADAALSGNTMLSELYFGSPAFNAASGGEATANTITQDSSASATGKPTFARAFEAGGTAAVFQCTAAFAWLASTTYSVNDYVSNGAYTYVCTTAGASAVSGGPTGTGSGITDGTCVWAYVRRNEIVLTGGVQIASGGVVSIDSFVYRRIDS